MTARRGGGPREQGAEDGELVERVLTGEAQKPRCELIAPLDNLLWDRRLIKAVFGFDYKWEIYTPQTQRRYGYYVLPVLYGDSFVGRVEAVCRRKTQTLSLENLWYEPDVRKTKKLHSALEDCLQRFMVFNGCRQMEGSIP